MNNRTNILIGLALLVLAAGIVSALFVISEISGYRTKIRQKSSDLARASAVAKRYAEINAIVEKNKQIYASAAKQAVPSFPPDVKVQDSVEKLTELGAGWGMRSVEISAPDVAPGSVFEFIDAAGRTVPPWKPSKLSIVAKPGVKSKVAITLSTVEKRN